MIPEYLTLEGNNRKLEHWYWLKKQVIKHPSTLFGRDNTSGKGRII